MYKIPVLPSVHRWATVCPASTILLFLRFGSAWCQGLPAVWVLSMVRPWSVSFSGLLLPFLSPNQIGPFWYKWKSGMRLGYSKNINSHLNLVGSPGPCPQEVENHLFPRGPAFSVISTDVGTRTRLWLTWSSVFPSHSEAKVWQRTRWYTNSWRLCSDAVRRK